jgi:hypothetical protein
MRNVTVVDTYIIPHRHKLKVTSVVRSEVTNWVFDVAVTVQGGVALKFNTPVALGPDPDDKHHYWWMGIGSIVRFVMVAKRALIPIRVHFRLITTLIGKVGPFLTP